MPLASIFQSTHPHGVRPRRSSAGAGAEHFNPRTHMGCDDRLDSQYPRGTHFNPRTHMGCDDSYIADRCLGAISIHAPTWGATTDGAQIYRHWDYFNPRTHMGCDAPTWGATKRFRYFNPRTHMGCDNCSHLASNTVGKFQSTHPHGVRLRIVVALMIQIYFNPRTHMGCDGTLSLVIVNFA